MAVDGDLERKTLAAELVCHAIADLNEKKAASTLNSIRRYIGTEYKLAPNVIDDLLVPSLQSAVQFGVIKNEMGHYQLSDLMDNIVDFSCKRRHGSKEDAACCPPPKCSPKRKCKRSSKNFRRIDYKIADVCYQDKDNPCGSPKACGGGGCG